MVFTIGIQLLDEIDEVRISKLVTLPELSDIFVENIIN